MITSTLAAIVLTINELMAANVGEVMSPAINFDSWIELYNPGDQAVDLGGMYLSNDATDLRRWQMPADMGSVPAKGFKVIWLGSNDIKSNQAPFKLDCDGGTICLSDANGNQIFRQDYPEAMSRTAWARTTDGTGDWGWTANSTPGATNSTATFATQRLDAPVVSQGSQLFGNSLQVSVNIPEGATLMYTTDGSVPKSVIQNGSGETQPTWIQMIKNGDCEGNDATCFVCRDADGNGDVTRITDGVGYNGSRGVKVHAVDNPTYEWDAQFFVYVPDYTLKAGDTYRFSMKVRANKPSHISAQSHEAPHDYIYWEMLDGGYNVTTEWQTITYEGQVTDQQAGSNGLKTIAFNLNEMNQENDFYFDDLSWEIYVAPPSWTNCITNSDCEGDDATCFVCRDADGNGDVNRITDGVGVNGSRGVKVHSIANAANDWAAQFFIYTPDHVWQPGEHYRFRMAVRADRASRVSVQSHSTPHNYISGQMLEGSYNITTEWQTISYEGDITSQQAGASGLQTIAFNLNINKDQANNFYFDDIYWELDDETRLDEPDTGQVSEDGLFTFSQTTNLCVRLFKEGYLPSVPVTRSYIKTDNQYTIPVVSIVGDKRYFTDPKIGLDCEGDGTNGKPGNGQDQPRNYNMDWDRPVNFSYLSPDGQMLFNQDVNISVSGGWTRSQRYRSFKLKSNKIFDGQNRFDFSFFPQKPYIRSKAVLVRNGGNDLWKYGARFMDPALQTIIQRSGIDLDVQSYVPVIEYVNGQLRGLLNLREVNNDKFVYANYGYDDEEIDMFENFTMTNGNSDVINRIFELGAHINNAGAYDELCNLLDIDEFTNYMAMELFIGNDDWPNNNIKAYRSQDDGRYRFISFDLDYAFSGCGNNYEDNPFTFFDKFKYMDFVSFFINLLSHDTYRRKFIDTFCLMGGSVFELGHVEPIVDELLQRVLPMNQLMAQMSQTDGNNPENSASAILEKLDGRNDQMMSHMQDYAPMQLSSATRQNVQLSANTSGAKIYINGIEVPGALFNGQLIAPVRLEAEAPAGYRFTAWKKGSAVLSTEPVIDLPSGNNLSLSATFTALTADERAAEGITPVRINEVSAANSIYVNEYFKRNDWVELYNTTSSSIDVEGMYISDNPDNPLKYQITKGAGQANTIIPAHGHLIIWCDKLEPLTQLHASFKLAAEGDEMLLTAADGSWTDRLVYGPMKGDETAGRYPDGTNNIITMNVPTIEQANRKSTYSTPIAQPSLPTGIHDLTAATELTARYVVERLVVRGTADGDVHVNILNLAGQQIGSLSGTLSSGYAEIPVSHLKASAYIAVITDAHGHKTVIKFMKD